MAQRTGRPTKFTSTLSEQLISLLAMGCTIEDSCAAVKITRTTFYNWIQQSETLKAIDPAERIAVATKSDEEAFLYFSDAVARAQAQARVVAVGAIRSALTPQPQVTETVDVYTEIRLRKNEKGEEVPYLYEERRTRRTVTEVAPDWRAAVEYLKRRDPEHWAPPTRIEVNWQDQAINDIRAGLITFEAMLEEFRDEALVAELFARAGVSTSIGESEAEDE